MSFRLGRNQCLLQNIAPLKLRMPQSNILQNKGFHTDSLVSKNMDVDKNPVDSISQEGSKHAYFMKQALLMVNFEKHLLPYMILTIIREKRPFRQVKHL